MDTIRLPAYAPLAFPVRPPPPPPRANATDSRSHALCIVAIIVGVGILLAGALGGVALAAVRAVDLTSLVAQPEPPAASTRLLVEHVGDDCAALALRASQECEDVQCFTAIGTELRACLAQPEQEARVCADLPDLSNATAAAQSIDTRCRFEEERDYSDCVRLMGIVQDHCANVGAREKH